MKKKMTETVTTPNSSSGAVMVDLVPHVLMELPKRSSLNRVLRRHRHKTLSFDANAQTLPPISTDLNFIFPGRFDLLLFDSGPGEDRLLILGDSSLLDGLTRSDIWLADGTFNVVPAIHFQLYTIHFQFINGVNPAALYCLLTNKSRATYDRLLAQLKIIVSAASPKKVDRFRYSS